MLIDMKHFSSQLEQKSKEQKLNEFVKEIKKGKKDKPQIPYKSKNAILQRLKMKSTKNVLHMKL